MENQIQEGQEQLRRENTDALENGKTKNPFSTNEERNLNRGLSKKEKRRVDALKQRLEPRIEKLEEQVRQHIANITNGSDKREEEGLQREENLSGGSFDSAPPTEETSKEDGDLEGGDQEDQANKTTEVKGEAKKETPITKLVNALQAAGLGEDPTALKLVADIAALDPRRMPVAKASHLIQPSGGGIPPAPDLRAEYEKGVKSLRPGDIDGLLELKREFRKKGLEIY